MCCVHTMQLYSMYIFVYLHTCADSSEATYISVCVCVCVHHQPPVQSDSFECPGKGYHVCTYMALACTFVYKCVSGDLGA